MEIPSHFQLCYRLLQVMNTIDDKLYYIDIDIETMLKQVLHQKH